MDASWLSVFWATLIGFALLFYVILDGYDLGVGILSGLTSDDSHRDTMMESVAPFWDGNEVWLILVGAGLFAAFPIVYSIFLAAFYLPVALMLMGLVFRGVAFEFRYHAGRNRRIWDSGFFLGSLVVSFVQGVAMGRMVQMLPVAGGQYAGGPFDWLTLFSLFCGIGLVLGYALLGAGWLIFRTQGPVQDWAYTRMKQLLPGVLTVLGLVAIYTLSTHMRVRARWLHDIWLAAFPLMIIMASWGVWIGIRRRIDWAPYGMSVIIFSAAFLTLEASFWPYIIPFSVTIQEAAAPVQSLSFLFYGAGIIVFPIILFYTGMVYWILRGKV
jgi:cytochrome bd ubiquinol oxidase subunit II